MNTENYFRLAALIMLGLIILTGIKMRNAGKPYNAFHFNLHKFAAVISLVMVILIFLRPENPWSVLSAVIPALFTMVLIFLSMISGGLISAKKEMPAQMKIAHMMTGYLSVFAAVVYFLIIIFL